MAQNTIKIECNPYTKQVRYFWKNDSGIWSDLSKNPKSPFASSKVEYKDFAEATIAHKAYEILEMINETYNKEKKGVEIIVDGTKDDFEELEEVINSSFSDSGMFCTRGELYMLSAKEAMPQIEKIYSSLEKILLEHSDDEIGKLIARYSDTVKPEITLCVMGLYSSGKSAFINSLIGKEILPSASDPLTAKVYKINCEDTVWVAFQYDEVSYRLYFENEKWTINTSSDADLVCQIVDAVGKENNKEKRLYAALSVLNEFAIKEGKERQSKIEKLASKAKVSLKDYLEKNSIASLLKRNEICEYRLADTIEIGIPFNEKTELPIHDYKFVIFDTPGSNSAMHEEHKEILKKALQDRTNGLPIFVTNPDTLDSTDNNLVIDMIEKMGDSLDKSSTMIVINKADEKPEKELKEKRDNRKKLKVTSWKSSRIYFISSIVSLGNKIQNPVEEKSWIDSVYGSCYRDHYKKFNGKTENTDDLLQLYRYDILSENIRFEYIREADVLVLTNALKGLESLRRGSFIKFFEKYERGNDAKEAIDEFIDEIRKKLVDFEKDNNNIEIEFDFQRYIIDRIKNIFDDLAQNINQKNTCEVIEKSEDEFEEFEEFNKQGDELQEFKKRILEYVAKGMNFHLVAKNSGIEVIEKEIGIFGERLALYNKCVQAEKYLEEAIERLGEKIDSTTVKIKDTQDKIEGEIEEKIKKLEADMKSKCDNEKIDLDIGFAASVVGPYTNSYLDANRISGLIGNTINEAKKNSDKWKESGIFKVAKNSTEYVKYVKKLVSKKYDDDVKTYAMAVNDNSEKFWKSGIEKLKDKLLQVVYDSEELTDEQKKIAKDTIMEVGKMQISHSELQLGVGSGIEEKQFLWVKWNEFNAEDAESAYRKSLSKIITTKNKSIVLENTNAFENWKIKLINLLRIKLSQLNPKVVELNKKLVHYQELEKELNDQLAEIKKAQYNITQLLSFKELPV